MTSDEDVVTDIDIKLCSLGGSNKTYAKCKAIFIKNTYVHVHICRNLFIEKHLDLL